MTSVGDLWRAIDPEARLVSGALLALERPVRGVLRSRAAPPHLPASADGELLVLDASLAAGRSLDLVLDTLRAAGLRPAALVIAAANSAARFERADDDLPIFASARAVAPLAERFAAYLRDEPGQLAGLATVLRLALAEAALADPDPATPAGLTSARIGRGVAIVIDGELRSLHARHAGRALAARFAAAQSRLLGGSEARAGSSRRTRDGLWLLERRIRPGASAWLFDDRPFAAVDEMAIEALTLVLRAVLRRPAAKRIPRPAVPPASPASPPAITDRMTATLLAVARANGRIAPAARALGVHRNTVLYRLRAARASRGIDPRRPEDALRILAEAERSTR